MDTGPGSTEPPPRSSPPPEPTVQLPADPDDTTVVNVAPQPAPVDDGRPPRAPWVMLALVIALVVLGLVWWFLTQSQQESRRAATATSEAVSQTTATAQAAAAAQQTAAASQATA